MKIGILTYHRAENYGALLQAYAMMTYLRSLGHDVSFVDYWPKYHSDYFRLFSWKRFINASFKGKVLMLLNATFWLLPNYIRKKRMQLFMREKLALSATPLYTDRERITERYDIVVYGSDQIWRKQNLGGVKFDDWYFGSSNVLADRKIVYAGSMGSIDTTTEDDIYFRDMMANFNSISVREQDLKTYLHSLGVESCLVADPVFLLSADQWRTIAVRPEQAGKYILFYNLLSSPKSSKFAEMLSAKTGLPIVEITKSRSLSHFKSRRVTTASVPEFLGLIDKAEIVVSNSFHGVAFSILFDKQFYAVGMGNKANRVVSLLRYLGLEDNYIKDDRLDESSISLVQKDKNDILNVFIHNSAKYFSMALDC